MEENQNNEQSSQGQTIIINQQQKKSNGLGTAGFVLALIALFLGWVPVLGWILWLLGLIFSFIGVFKKPKGLAIAGLVISLIGIIVLIVISAGVLGGVSNFMQVAIIYTVSQAQNAVQDFGGEFNDVMQQINDSLQ